MDGGRTSYDKPPSTEPPGDPVPEPPPVVSHPEAPPVVPDPAAASIARPVTVPRPVTEPSQVTLTPTQKTPAAPVASASPLDAMDAHSGVSVTSGAAAAGDPGVRTSSVPTPPRPAVPALDAPDADRAPLTDEQRNQEPLSRALRLGYGIILAVLVLSALGLAYVHLHHSNAGHPTHAIGTTTTSSTSRTAPTVAVPPTSLQSTPDAAANALVSSWGTGNRAAALTVASPPAVSTLFAMPYSSGMAEDRGCSSSFLPIVCTFGPPGGASPADPIYEISVSKAPGGWYVSSVKTEN